MNYLSTSLIFLSKIGICCQQSGDFCQHGFFCQQNGCLCHNMYCYQKAGVSCQKMDISFNCWDLPVKKFDFFCQQKIFSENMRVLVGKSWVLLQNIGFSFQQKLDLFLKIGCSAKHRFCWQDLELSAQNWRSLPGSRAFCKKPDVSAKMLKCLPSFCKKLDCSTKNWICCKKAGLF